ncbi:MAG TPA: DUF1835 domain-containing protein [Dehalococcoidia bacterium]|nr:DUF1835 domain-containing protein [Dehalococcoidia bacterium]
MPARCPLSMTPVLHITNGDSAGIKIERTGIPGRVLPWRDILHEGPVPAGLSLTELSRVRAQFIADRGWAPEAEVLASFAERDTLLATSRDCEEVVLWFEHDLYDQLQLTQILDWLAGRSAAAAQVTLICIDEFPGRPAFKGLGELTAEELASLYPGRVPVSTDQVDLAARAWSAFTSPDPTAIEALLAGDTNALPFLRPGFSRFLEEFPAVHDGLSRTERQVLASIESGKRTPVDIFLADQDQEDYFFPGDLAVWTKLAELGRGPYPLISLMDGRPFTLPTGYPTGPEFHSQEVVLTEVGRRVLAGEADRVALNGIDRWYGGTHLRGQRPRWRWDGDRRRLVESPGH